MDFRSHSSYPRGMRNNNPGNVRPFTAITYQHQVDIDPLGYAIFDDMQWGIRAMALDVIGDIEKRGLTTLAKLIHEYAPASDGNDEAGYVNYLVNKLGIGANDAIPHDQALYARLLRAMVEVEEGVNYANMIPQSDFAAGISLYGGSSGTTAPSGGNSGGILAALAAAAIIGYGLMARR